MIWLQHGEESDADDWDVLQEADSDDLSTVSSEAGVWSCIEEPTRYTVAEALADNPMARATSLDLVTCISSMFRILDLVSEQGSGGLGMVFFRGRKTMLV